MSAERTSPASGLLASPGWTALGAAGSVLLTLAGPRLAGGTVRWWFDPRLPGGHAGAELAFYAGMAALAGGWLGLGRTAGSPAARPAQLWPVAALWSAPLLLGAPLFSQDVYSYFAQGTIAHLGLSPYHATPSILGPLGHARVLDAVYPFWRRVTAPYGPLFLEVVAVIAGATGSNLVLGALLVRCFELIGLVLLAVFAPRLARSLGADPARATWLAALSPLVLLQLLAASHNDLLMAGLMVAGVALALERRPLLGIAVCALAATVKLPAVLAIVFVGLSWARAQPSRRARAGTAAATVLTATAVIALVSFATGLGLGWISTSLFSIPARVRLAVTPSTAVAWTVAAALRDLGVAASFTGIASVLKIVALAVAAVVVVALLARSRTGTVPRLLGWALIALAFGGPAAWPWYFSWGLVLVAVVPGTQHRPALPAALMLTAFLIKPSGMFALPLHTAPIVVGCYALAGLAVWYARRRERRPRAGRDERATGPRRSALARSSLG